MATKVAGTVAKVLLPFIPLDKVKKYGAGVVALFTTLNPMNIVTWILLGLSTLILYFWNPFNIVNTTDKDGNTKKSFLKAFGFSFLILIPYYFINWIVLHFILKILF